MAAADQTELEVGELLRANTAAMTHEEMVAPGCCYMLDILWGCVCLYILHPVGARVCGSSEYFSECLLERMSKRIPASSEHAQRLANDRAVPGGL